MDSVNRRRIAGALIPINLQRRCCGRVLATPAARAQRLTPETFSDSDQPATRPCGRVLATPAARAQRLTHRR